VGIPALSIATFYEETCTMKRFLFLLLIAAMAFGTQATWATADDSTNTQKPVAVVSLAGYDAFMGDVNYMAKLANNPELGTGLEGIIKLFTKNQGLAGLDKTRPWGAVLFAAGDNVTGYGFLPVTDLTQLGDALEGIIGKPEDVGGGVHKIQGKRHGDKPVFVKEGKGWAFFADAADKLVNLPENPAALLGGLEKQYQVAFRLNAADVPEQHRQKLIDEIKKGAERDSAKHFNESDAEHALRVKITGEVVKYLETVINDLQDVTLGWNLDSEAGKAYLEASVVGKPGTQLAKSMQYPNDSHSRFAGFGAADAAIVGDINGRLPPLKAELLEDVFDSINKNAIAEVEKNEHDAAKAEAIKQLVGKLFPLLHDTIANGRIDKGFAAVVKPDAVTVLAGGALVNNGRIDEMLKIVLQEVKREHPDKAAAIDSWVKLGAEKMGDITFNTISIPIPPEAGDRNKVVSLIGDTLEVVIGSSKDSVYIAAGREPLAALKKAIEQSAAAVSKSVPPVEISVSLTKVADFIAAVGKPHEKPRAAKFAALLKQTPNEDHAVLRAQFIENGVKYRIEVETGVLKAFVQMR
jgi:hypothetical protein